VNGSSIDWTEYKDEDIQRFIHELEAEQNRRRVEKRKALKAQISDMVKSQGLSLSELLPTKGTSGHATAIEEFEHGSPGHIPRHGCRGGRGTKEEKAVMV
jgi:H-NS histone family